MSPLKCCVAKSATQVFTQRNEDLRGFLAVAVVPSNTVSAQYESGGDRPRLFSLVRQLVPRAWPNVSVTSAAEISSQCCVTTQPKSVDSTDRQSDSVPWPSKSREGCGSAETRRIG